jgi:hypothetical protein
LGMKMASTYRAVEVSTPSVLRVVERPAFEARRLVKSACASKHVAFVIPI